MGEQILAAVFVIGLLLATVWVLRRKGLAAPAGIGRSNRGGRLQVVERVVLTAQHSVHLVRVGEEFVLIGVSPGSCGQIMKVRGGFEDGAVRRAL